MVQETKEGLVTESGMAPVDAVETVATEKMVPQSEVNGIVGSTRSKAHAKGYDSGKQEGYDLARQELSASMDAQQGGAQFAPAQAPAAQAPGFGADDLKNQVQDVVSQMYQDAQQQEHQNQVHQAHNNVTNKILSETQDVPGFAEKLAQNGIDLSQPTHLTQHLSQVDNPGAVLNELIDNPHKFATLNSLPPAMVAGQMKVLSEGLKANQQPVNLPNTPLSTPNPSLKGTDSGAESVYDRIFRMTHGSD